MLLIVNGDRRGDVLSAIRERFACREKESIVAATQRAVETRSARLRQAYRDATASDIAFYLPGLGSRTNGNEYLGRANDVHDRRLAGDCRKHEPAVVIFSRENDEVGCAAELADRPHPVGEHVGDAPRVGLCLDLDLSVV